MVLASRGHFGFHGSERPYFAKSQMPAHMVDVPQMHQEHEKDPRQQDQIQAALYFKREESACSVRSAQILLFVVQKAVYRIIASMDEWKISLHQAL